ncbi:MAG TPA: efflux RND transporter periplasmic adaptor subunit, partial [Gemmatimonadaceae bacterium]
MTRHTNSPAPDPSVSGRGRRWRWWGGAGAAVAAVLLIATTWTLAVRRERGAPPAPSGGKTAMQDMSGMTTTPEGAVQLTANEIRHFGVTFGSADVRPLIVQVRAVGTVTLDERTVAQITPKVGGYVERLYVNSTGQSVRRGAPLATIYSPELLAAEQDLL